jgi:hypothetical protein
MGEHTNPELRIKKNGAEVSPDERQPSGMKTTVWAAVVGAAMGASALIGLTSAVIGWLKPSIKESLGYELATESEKSHTAILNRIEKLEEELPQAVADKVEEKLKQTRRGR